MRRQAMRRARLVLCTSLAAAAAGLPACQPGDDLVEDDGLGVIEQGLVGATLTTTDPAVVALLTASGNVFCTGTLISPRVVLTAAHCIDDGGANFSAYFGDDVEASGGRRIAADRVMKHPGWTGDLSGGNDIGLVLLASAADPELPIALNTVPLTTRDGGLYRAVGFGIYDRDTRALDGKKRTAMFRIESFPSTYVEVTDPTPDDAVNTVVCQGDSGGPGFITVGTDEVLAGVHSYSIEGCFNPSGDTRVDLFAAVFVQPWIDANDPSCGVDGLCARKGCSADPDCEPCGADGTCATDCALPDWDCPTQQLGQTCRADSQCTTGRCVAWEGDPRVKYCTEACSGDSCPSDMTCQLVQPLGNICYYPPGTPPPGALDDTCAGPADCAENVCEDGACTYSCDVRIDSLCQAGFECVDRGQGPRCYGEQPVTEDSGGCGCRTSPGGGPAGAVVGLMFGMVVVRRRRRDRRSC